MTWENISDQVIIKNILEIIAWSGAVLFLALILINRTKDGNHKGIGARIIQLCVVVLIFPTILILGLEKVLTGETLGTLLGGVMGYVLSGIGDYKPKTEGK